MIISAALQNRLNANEGIDFLNHFDSIFFIPVTVFPTRFPHRNSEKRHYETNIIPYLATFENARGKLIASNDPKNLHD